MAVETDPTQETQQTEPQEEVQEQDQAPSDPAEQEQPPEEVEAKDPDAPPEEQEDDGGEEEPDPQAQAKPEDKRRPKTGFRRTISRLERQIADRDALLQQVLSRIPQAQQPGATPDKPASPEQKTAEFINNLVNQGVQKALQEQQQLQSAAQREQKWSEQLPADEDEAYEVRQWISDVKGLPAGPVKEALLTSDIAPKIISVLLRDRQELARISALPDVAQAREILRLEAKLSSSGGAPAMKPKTAARPPAPPSSVGGSAAKSTRNPDDMLLPEYKRFMRSRGR